MINNYVQSISLLDKTFQPFIKYALLESHTMNFVDKHCYLMAATTTSWSLNNDLITIRLALLFGDDFILLFYILAGNHTETLINSSICKM